MCKSLRIWFPGVILINVGDKIPHNRSQVHTATPCANREPVWVTSCAQGKLLYEAITSVDIIEDSQNQFMFYN